MAGTRSTGGIEASYTVNTAAADAAMQQAAQVMQYAAAQAQQTGSAFGGVGTAAATQTVSVTKAAQALGHYAATSQQAAAAARQAATATNQINAGMAGVGRVSGSTANRLMAVGNVLDDLQYVGQQGLRPIINNLIQIAPAAGIAVLGFELIRRNWGLVEHALAGTEAGAMLDLLTSKVHDLGESLGLVKTEAEQAAEAIKEEIKAAADLVPGRAQSERGGAFREAVAQAGGSGALADQMFTAQYGNDRPNAEVEASVRESNRKRIEQALKGDQQAIDQIINTVGGTLGANYTAALPETKQAAADAQRRAEEAAAEREKIAEDRRKRTEAEQQRLAEQAAAGYRDEFRRRESTAGAMGPDLPATDRRAIMHGQLRDRLTASGLSTEDANAVASQALDKLASDLDATVRERMAGGMSRSEALGSLAEEDRRRQQAEAERARSEALQLAGERAPNLDRQAATTYDNAVRLNGADPRAAGEVIGRGVTAELQRRGLSEDQAKAAAGQYVADARDATSMNLFQMLNDPERFAKMAGQVKGPEVFNAESLYARVQAGVGGPEDKAEKTIREIANGNRILSRIESTLEDVGFGARAQ